MKKIILLLFISSSIGFAGCKSDKPKDLIVKKWKITNIEVPNMPIPDSVKATAMKGTMEFTKEGKINITGMGNDQSGTYTISDDGKTLFVVTNGKTESNDIIELSSSKMVLSDKANNSRLTVVPR
jgi:heat shock protein HslJ